MPTVVTDEHKLKEAEHILKNVEQCKKSDDTLKVSALARRRLLALLPPVT